MEKIHRVRFTPVATTAEWVKRLVEGSGEWHFAVSRVFLAELSGQQRMYSTVGMNYPIYVDANTDSKRESRGRRYPMYSSEHLERIHGLHCHCRVLAVKNYPRAASSNASSCFVGDLERLRRFWLTGTCNPKKEEKKASEPLAPEQFLSAFLLLLCGILLAIGLMGLEHGYMKWMRGRVVKTDRAGCCALVSLVSIKLFSIV